MELTSQKQHLDLTNLNLSLIIKLYLCRLKLFPSSIVDVDCLDVPLVFIYFVEMPGCHVQALSDRRKGEEFFCVRFIE